MAASKLPGSERLSRYVDTVLNPENESLYPQTIIAACLRHRADLTNPRYYFDAATADKAIAYIEKLPHPKGVKQGKPIHLEDWQCWMVGSLFGWKMASSGYRKFNSAYWQIPRKNGKTLLAVMVGLIMFGPDQEPGAEVLLGSTNKVNARKQIWNPVKYIVEHCHKYRDAYGIDVRADALLRPENNSILQLVIGKPSDGDNPHFGLVDEFHEHKTSVQFDTFETGMGSRMQPLLLAITTAGYDLGSPCYQERCDCKEVLDAAVDGGEDLDERKFIAIWEPDQNDKWESEETLRKVNPNLGISVSVDYLLGKLKNAKRSARKQNDYRTKYLNQWVGAQTAWIDLLAWQRQKKPMKLEDCAGMECCLAVDLSSYKDIAALCCTFRENDKYYAIPFFFVPSKAAHDNKRYRKYVDAGLIIETPGAKTDQSKIQEKIVEICKLCEVHLVGFDRWQGDFMISNLMDMTEPEINAVVFGQSPKNMSTPMKELEAMVIDGQFFHDGNAAMNWQVSNVMAYTLPDRQIKPVKSNRNDENCKIDGAVAAIMTVGLWNEYDLDGDGVSIYEEQELTSV